MPPRTRKAPALKGPGPPHAQPAPRIRTLASLGSLHLQTGQRFWYIFDFGDNHCFSVSVLALGADPAAQDRKPRILQVHGDPPEQYPDLEDQW